MASLKDKALDIGRAYESLSGFACDQEITAGGLRINASVKFKKPRKLTVEYDKYRNPVEEFQADFFGGPEFDSNDLENARLVYNGDSTWIHLISKEVAIKKQGRRLFTPFAGVDILGQLGFLTDILSDFLLKDDGEGEINDREVYRLGLKPKAYRKSLFLKEEVFSLDSAQLAIDKETKLPLKITYRPGQRDQLRFMSSQGGPIYVQYSNYRIDGPSDGDFQFDHTKVENVFEEEKLSKDEFTEKFPIEFNLEGLEKQGFKPATEELSLSIDREKDRAYATLGFVSESEEGEEQISLQLLAGNYLSREMNRHRSFLSENGENININGNEGKLVDRGENVKDRLPKELKSDILEIGLQVENGFYYLLGQDVDRDRLIQALVTLTSEFTS